MLTPIFFGCILLALGWVYYLGIYFYKGYTQEMALLKDVIKQQAQLLIQHEQSLVSITQGEQSSVHLLQQLERGLHALEDRYQAIQYRASKGKDYHQLSELIKKGFDHEEMMKGLGLSRGEIQLMKSLNRSRVAS